MIDLSTVTDVVIEGIDHSDRPDYCDAYIASATIAGKPATDEQIEELNDDSDFKYQQVLDFLH